MATFAGKQPGHDDPTLSHPDNTGPAPYTGESTLAGEQPGHTSVIYGSVKKLPGIDGD